jgi:inosine-uridine nucleoside N-ribohydrolase
MTPSLTFRALTPAKAGAQIVGNQALPRAQPRTPQRRSVRTRSSHLGPCLRGDERGRGGLWVSFIVALFFAALAAPAVSHAAEPQLVIYDNDFYSPACSDILPLITNPNVKVLGFTVVTGDGWRDEETNLLLRFLEIAGRPDIPVINGAVFPLVNTYDRTKVWEAAYGKLVWKGAWNEAGPGNTNHPTDPWLVPPDPAGTPTLKAAPGMAADFLIEQVHKYPHQVTIIAAGPMTNIALAIRMDPQFASLAKQLVFMGGIIDVNLPQVTGNTDFNTDFNLIFDPEAAHIMLTAPWPKIVVVGNVSNDVIMDKPLADRIDAKKSPVSDLVARNVDLLPLWDQLAAAIAVDPTLVTRSVDAWMDVEIAQGPYYGSARLWPDATRPHQGEQEVEFVTAVDSKRFLDGFVKAAQFEAQ